MEGSRGRVMSRNQGKTTPTMTRQKNTRVMFCSSISACRARRTSTAERMGEEDIGFKWIRVQCSVLSVV